MIEFKGVTKKYDNVIALNNLNLVIPAGKIFGFLGHNGAGKSTTIKSLVSILNPDAGQIIVDGKDLAEQRFLVKKMIGYVPDSPDIFLQLTAAEYWDMLAAAYEIKASEKATRIKELAGSFGILERQDEVMESYSHGMRQKAIIVGALLSEPDIWVLDEPLQGLDPQAAYDLKEMMKKHVRRERR